MASSSTAWKKAVPFAVFSFVSFLCGVGLLLLMLGHAERLAALGLVGNLYYIVLLPLGLSAAAFLFGAFRSYARYTGKTLWGTLELGGPIVGFALVVIGGFYLPKPLPEGFAITVLVHGENGPHDLVLRNTGTVWMTLGADQRNERIGDKGQADFKNIPATFRGQQVPVSVEAEGFELANPQARHSLTGVSIDVMVRHRSINLVGRVQDTDGHPVTNAVVRSGESRTTVDPDGQFSLPLTGGSPTGGIEVEVSALGFETWRGKLGANDGRQAIMLHRAH